MTPNTTANARQVNPWKTKFAQRIDGYIKSRGITRTKASRELGYKPTHLSRCLQHPRQMTDRFIETVCRTWTPFTGNWLEYQKIIRNVSTTMAVIETNSKSMPLPAINVLRPLVAKELILKFRNGSLELCDALLKIASVEMMTYEDYDAMLKRFTGKGIDSIKVPLDDENFRQLYQENLDRVEVILKEFRQNQEPDQESE